MWHLSNIVFAILKDTGTELMPTDIKYYQLFGGEKVIFEKEEVTDMKKFGKPGIIWDKLLSKWEGAYCSCAAGKSLTSWYGSVTEY